MSRTLASIALAFLCLFPAWACAGSSEYCDPLQDLSAEAQDRMIRVAALVKRELEAAGQPTALVSRTGLHLGWLGQRYSHAGVSLRESEVTPWSIRQLYFSCDEKRPRLYDQGISGFVVGAQDEEGGYVSIVTLPEEAARKLDQAARSNREALALLSPNYSANAYPYSTLYQNCNQWLAELLAFAWTQEKAAAPDREQAQHWLHEQGYTPTEIEVWRPLLWLAHGYEWLNFNDQPDALLSEGRLQFSLPPAVEQYTHKRWPEAQRIEICYTTEHAVVHRGWDNIPDGCPIRDGDEVVSLKQAAAATAPASP
jgi:hypothetical protein